MVRPLRPRCRLESARRGEMADIERILIVGGGIAGLSAAAVLSRQGLSAELVERTATWPAIGPASTCRQPLQPFQEPLPGYPATARPDPSDEPPPPGLVTFTRQHSISGHLCDFCSLSGRFGEVYIPFS